MVSRVILVEWVASPMFLYFVQFFHIFVQVCLDAVEIALRKRVKSQKPTKLFQKFHPILVIFH